ncbi:hypothetical protein [uncultured Limosilactobacillus sp.]|uniref:hypothetical protein n=1 Tax=uncultured Limosilactobacillus sp. TaxID=2837629 RepID=UPI0025E6B7C4|nr:hypothetical protein [uncultured Limosilactobacillus sp.]
MKFGYRAALLLLNVVALLLMIILSVLQFNVSIPSGNLHITVVALIAVALMTLTDVANGLVVTAISFLLIFFLRIMNWQNLVQLVLLVIVAAIIIATCLPHHRRLSHQQTIWLGLAIGICQLVLLALTFFIVGWHYFGNLRGALIELQQAFPAALLSGLLDSLLVPAIVFSGAKLADKLGLFNYPGDGGHQDPPVIDLSSHRSAKDDEQQNQH